MVEKNDVELSAAWRIVEEMLGKGYRCYLTNEIDDRGWACEFATKSNQFEEFGSTVSEAIGKSAFKALKGRGGSIQQRSREQTEAEKLCEHEWLDLENEMSCWKCGAAKDAGKTCNG